MSQPPPPWWALAMLRIRIGGKFEGGEEVEVEVEVESVWESERAASIESAFITSMLVGGSWGHVWRESGGRLSG